MELEYLLYKLVGKSNGLGFDNHRKVAMCSDVSVNIGNNIVLSGAGQYNVIGDGPAIFVLVFGKNQVE